MVNLQHTPVHLPNNRQRANSEPQSNAETDEKTELSANIGHCRPKTNQLDQSAPNDQLNVIQDNFVMNELNRITHQQTVEETVRISMQDQLNRMMGMMQDFTNGMKVMQEIHSRNQQSSGILNTSPILGRKETQLTQPTQSTQFTAQSTIKVKARSPDAFDGSKSINPKLWLQSMKRYLKLTNTPANLYASTTASYLSGTAAQWYEGELLRHQYDEDQMSWDQFEGLFNLRFQPIAASQLSLTQLTEWKQTRSLEDYINGFSSISANIPIEAVSEESMVTFFINGLRPNIRNIVALKEPRNLQEAIHAAQRFGDFKVAQCFGEVTDNNNRSNPQSNYNRMWRGNSSNAIPVGRNYNFNNVKTRGSTTISNRHSSHLNAMSELEGEIGTDDYEVEGRAQHSSTRDNLVNGVHWDDEKKRLYVENRCFNCKGTGHFTRQCKAPRQQRSRFHLN